MVHGGQRRFVRKGREHIQYHLRPALPVEPGHRLELPISGRGIFILCWGLFVRDWDASESGLEAVQAMMDI